MDWLKKLDGMNLTPSEEVRKIFERAIEFAVDGTELYSPGKDGLLYCVCCGELKEYGHLSYRCPALVFTKMVDEVLFRRMMEERRNLGLKT
jgi:hypothetical protein